MKIFRMLTFLLICVIGCVVSMPNSAEIRKSGKKAARKRSKRYTILYPWLPYNTAIALAVVLAIPLKLKGRNVYMSYNFETNFYMPYFDKGQGLVPLPFATIDAPAVNSGTIPFYENGGQVRELNGGEDVSSSSSQNETLCMDSESSTATNSTENPKTIQNVSFKKSNSTENSTKRNNKAKQSKKKTGKTRVNREILSTLLSRKKLYKILQHKLEMAGFNGEECILKAICETADHPFAEHNGVLGDIMYIVFTPTTSRDEKLPQQFYDAIDDGKSGRCRYYNTLCPRGILDFITKTMQ